MSDAKFRPRFVPQSYGDRVQRGAVLHPMFGVLTNEAEVIEATFKLVGVWRKALLRLQPHNWLPRTSGDPTVVMQYARNCRPSFVACQPATAMCCARYICPFCYGRGVRDVWDSLDLAFPNPRSPSPPPTFTAITEQDETRDSRVLEFSPPREERRDGEFPYWLIERRNEINVPFLPTEAYKGLLVFMSRPRTLQETAAGVKASRTGVTKKERVARFAAIAKRRSVDFPEFQQYLSEVLRDLVDIRAGLRRLPTLGMYATTIVEPTAYGWHVENRQLFMVQAGVRLDGALADTRGKLVTHTEPTRKTIFESVIRTCAFPKKLLFRDPALLALLLRTRKGFRLTATTGRFRNQASIQELRRRDQL